MSFLVEKDFSTLSEIVTNERVKECVAFAETHHLKWLFVHQTAHQTIEGTLSDGHNRLTLAQKYSGALRESRSYATEIVRAHANAKRAKADHIDALAEKAKALTEQDHLRAEAKLTELELAMADAKVHAEGLMYMLNAAMEVAKYLEPIVTKQYPSFEASERDNNLALADYQAAKRKDGYDEHMPHLMLNPLDKAKVGFKTGQQSLTKALEYAETDALYQVANGDVALLTKVMDAQIEGRKKLEQPGA